MVQRMALVVICLLGGCVDSRSVVCGPLVCSEASVCAPSGDRCVQPQQLDICTGQADGAGCSFPGVSAGSCSKGICEPVGCGNGVVEVDLAEVCDDGNRISGDGCNGLCTSREICGDGVAEARLGEQCDCGDAGMTVAGCTGPNSNDPGATCRPDTCQLARCGDGIVDPFELCDDGNTVPGDGCRADCTGRWTSMYSNTFATLEAIWGSAPDNVYAVGESGTIVHYDGVAWSRMATPTPVIGYSDVWGVGNEVYAIGNTESSGRIDRFDGTSWAPFRTFATNQYLSAIHGRSATDFWVGGANAGSPVLYHFTGTSSPTSTSCSGLAAGINSIWVDPASTKAWATDGNGGMCVLSTGVWTLMSGIDLEWVWGVSGTELYGVTDSYTTVAKRSGDGMTWTAIPDVAAIVTPRNLGGAANDVGIVGDQGRAIRFDGTAWSLVPAPVPFDLTDVWGHAAGTLFIVGENGTILF